MIELVELQAYEGLLELPEFLTSFEEKVSEPQRLLAIEEELKPTLAHWWENHMNAITIWNKC